MKKVQLMTLCGALALGGASLLGGTQVFAYENAKLDPNAQVQEVKKSDNAKIPAEGTFETFDPTKPIDPNKPNPGTTDKAWVDVKIPSKILFGQTDVSKGIISPTYAIENLSTKGVKVSIADFTNGQDADKLDGRLDLNLKGANGDIMLRSTDKKKTTSFPAEIGTIATQNAKINFTLGGNVAKGFDFAAETVKPQYELVLQFEVQ